MAVFVGALIMFGSLLALVGLCAVLDAVADFRDQARVYGWRPVVRAWSRSLWIRWKDTGRDVRRAVALWWRIRVIRMRERVGYGRSAWRLFRVCVPVWVARYQLWERVSRLWAAVWVQFRACFAVELGWVRR